MSRGCEWRDGECKYGCDPCGIIFDDSGRIHQVECWRRAFNYKYTDRLIFEDVTKQDLQDAK